ncbi:melanocyte-stimulating hormone receptor-like [Stylophora pistillata]|uniref:melanocyte-stimulating hormone receptor-like n=1 Tax=Stylophora pistillata TaxID=50429 RepID=UPI000C03C984|nr:melanocyte-stimulating hormone receptor-like [Stylophora pistillata]
MNDSQNSTCEVLMHHYAITTEVDDLRFTYISNSILNSLLSHSAIMLNIVTIYAIRKTSSFPKTLKTLLLSLAVSDIGVGCLVQPFYTSLLIKNLVEEIPSCNTFNMFGITLGLFSMASFLGVVAVSVDRFLAVQLHLRYQELVTHKRVVAVVISIWLLSVFLTSWILWVPFLVHSIFLIIFGLSFFLVTTTVYLKIYMTVRHHKKQIQSLQRLRQVEMANTVNVLKSALGIFYVYLVFVACYLPYMMCLVLADTTVTNNSTKVLYFFSYTFLFMNSSLNPVIYCWKMRHIRHAIMDTLRNMPWNRKQIYSSWHRSAVTTESAADLKTLKYNL